MIEEWRVIDGYEKYEVSNLGRIKSKVRTKHHILKGRPNGYGYLHVALFIGDGSNVRRQFPIHRLVAKAFVDNSNSYYEVNHIDGIKTNNNANNLEWCSRSENIAHSIRIGLRDKPSKTKEQILSHNRNLAKAKRKLKDSQIFEILNESKTLSELSKIYGVSKSRLSAIRCGQMYQDVYQKWKELHGRVA